MQQPTCTCDIKCLTSHASSTNMGNIERTNTEVAGNEATIVRLLTSTGGRGRVEVAAR